MTSSQTQYAFFGSPKFAALILGGLISHGYLPKVVVCNPDRPVGRKKIITPPPVKSLILNHGAWNTPAIKTIQPEKLDSGFKIRDSGFKIDLFIVAAYAKIIPKAILEIPRLGTIGVHPSLLPKYRGASPIQSALLAGEEKTGVTLYLMDEKMDHGPVLAQAEIAIDPNDNYGSLEEKLGNLGAKLLIESLPKIKSGQIKPQDQNHAQASFTKKFKTEDGFINEKD
ncbi:MAG: methionyl-tRNA formyltransferase, partial [Patescibacteria group bacterium]